MVTREHRDLDVLVPDRGPPVAMDLLFGRGFSVETDWLPVRVEMGKPGCGWVDLHPLLVQEDGSAIQAALGGESFCYAPDAFTSGCLDGRVIPCISESRQREFHQGYELRPQDRHDIAALDSLHP